MHAGVSFGLCVAGASFTGGATAASRSVAAFKAPLVLTGTMIAVLLVAALSTPPGVVSQLALAVALIA